MKENALGYLPINLLNEAMHAFAGIERECSISDHDRISKLGIFPSSRIYGFNQDIFDAKTIFPSDREHKKRQGFSRWVVKHFIEFQTENRFGIVKNKGVTTCLDTSVFITTRLS